MTASSFDEMTPEKRAFGNDEDSSSLSSFASSVSRKLFFKRPMKVFWMHLVLWLLLTAHFTFAILNRNTTHYYFGLLAVAYVFLSFKLVFKHFSTRLITSVLSSGWDLLIRRPLALIPERPRKAILYATPLVSIVILVLVSSPTENGSRLERLQSLVGLCLMVAFMWLTSSKRNAINWHITYMGILLQFLLGLITLKTDFGSYIFSELSNLVEVFLKHAMVGARFVLGDIVDSYMCFAIVVLPGVIFFAAFVQIVYYLGWMQWIIQKFAWMMVRLMDTSGSESVVAAASPFVGQGESALLVRPFLEYMTISELHTTMASGFATIAGSVLAAFIAMGIDGKSLITACVMSTPCSLALSKMRFPETEQSITKGNITIPKEEEKEVNVLHAAANGAAQGIHLAGLIAASLLAIVSLFHFCEAAFSWFWSWLNPPVPITIELILSYVFFPFAAMLGVPFADCLSVGRLLGLKITVNEFVAYDTLLGIMKSDNPISRRAYTLAVFALCGFANVSSIGIQIGCLGAIAPNRKKDIARIAMSAMLTGAMCTMMSASIAGMLM